MRAFLASFVALMMVTTLGATASAASSGDEIVDDWVAALQTRDASVIEAMPWGYPQIAYEEREAIAQAILERLVEEDEELRAQFESPALTLDERAGMAKETVDLLSALVFDRVGLLDAVRADADAAYQNTLAELPPAPELADHPLVDAVRRDVENLATIPEGAAETVRAMTSGVAVNVQPPSDPETAPLSLLFDLVPADARFAVCWWTDAGRACQEVLPFVPMPVDVTGDDVPDVLASLSVVGDPTQMLLGVVEEGGVAVPLSFRVEQIGLDPAPLEALIVGLFSFDGETLVAGFDAFTDDAPLAAHQAPEAITIVAHAISEGTEIRAGVLFQPVGAGPALRTIAGVASDDVWEPERLFTLDTSPVPGTLDVSLRAWTDDEGGHFEGALESDVVTDLTASIIDKPADLPEVSVASLTVEDVGPTLTLTVHRGAQTEAFEWQTLTPVPRIAFSEETWRYADQTLSSPLSWRRQTLDLTDVPPRIEVTIPGHGSVTLEAASILGSARHIRQEYDHATREETYHEVSASSIPTNVVFVADERAGMFQSTGILGRVSFQSAHLDTSSGPGAIAPLLFDLSTVTTNFIGVRGEADVQGDAIAVQLVSVPDSIVFTVMEVARGVGLDLSMSRGLGEVNGIIQIDDRRGILYLSNIPKQITINAEFDAATVRAGYDGSSGINIAKAVFTDLSKAADPNAVHAYVELLQLPRAVSLDLTRASDAPKLAYNAATSTTDVRAFVDEDLFGGDLRARALLWIDDLGAQTTLSLANVDGMPTLRLASFPPTKSVFLEGFASQRYTGSMSRHVGDDCCFDSFGYDVSYGYNMDATIRLENLRLRLTDVSALDLALHAPDLSVSGSFAEFIANWDTISLIGTSAAWLDVDLTVFWVDIDVWSWGWSSGTRYDLDLQIARYADQWGPLASVSISPCHFGIDVRPYVVETMTNGFRFTGFAGQRQYLSINPIAGGQTAIPPWLMQAYMAWTHGGWRLDWGC